MTSPAAGQAFDQSKLSGAGRIFDLGASAGPQGMGGAASSFVRDVSALQYNPAGLGLLEARQATLLHAQLFGGVTYDGLGYVHNFSRRPGGWGVQLLRLAATAPARDANNADAGSFGYSETGLSAGAGFRSARYPLLSWGGGVKMLQRSLGTSSDRLYGVDAGVQYGPLLSDRLSFGAVLRNALAKSSGDTADKLPAAAALGASYRPADAFVVALDVTSAKQLSAGAAYTLGIATVRAGMADGDLTFGGGLLFRRGISLDLAVVNSSALGLSQRVSLGYRFGSSKPSKMASFVADYVGNARTALSERDYVKASRELESAAGLDAGSLGEEWRRKASLLREIIGALELESHPLHAEELKNDPKGAVPAARAIAEFLEGRNGPAMIFAHLAAGSAEGNPVFVRLLEALAKASGEAVIREDVVPADMFVRDRLKKAVDDITAGRYGAAVRACQAVLLVSPNDVLAWTRLGSAYFAAGDKRQARQAYEKALALDPGNAKLEEFVKTNLPQ